MAAFGWRSLVVGGGARARGRESGGRARRSCAAPDRCDVDGPIWRPPPSRQRPPAARRANYAALHGPCVGTRRAEWLRMLPGTQPEPSHSRRRRGPGRRPRRRPDVLHARPSSVRGDAAGYEPRRAEDSILYRIVSEHLEAFIDYAATSYERPLPRYVIKELRGFLKCGRPAVAAVGRHHPVRASPLGRRKAGRARRPGTPRR